jgi:hypothetical protein
MGVVNGVHAGGQIWCIYIVFIYESRTMKLLEVRGKECGRMIEGVNLIKIYFKHIFKCHNVSLVQLL